jgi:hypothetical protein
LIYSSSKVICFYASAHNNFISEDVVEGSLVFADTDCDSSRSAIADFFSTKKHSMGRKCWTNKIVYSRMIMMNTAESGGFHGN